MAELLPAIVLSVFFLILFFGAISSPGRDAIKTVTSGAGLLLVLTTVVFVVVAILYLLGEPPWAADVLKVLVGVLVGVAGSQVSSSAASTGDIFGDGTKVAGRDINEMIDHVQHMHGEVAEIREAVVNAGDESQPSDYLFIPLFSGDAEPVRELAHVVRVVGPRGWRLHTTTRAYSDAEGLLLVFTRPAAGSVPAAYQGLEVLEVEDV